MSELWPLTFGVVCTDGQTEVTFALALLHGCWPLMFQTLIGRLAGVGQTLHRTHLLTQTTSGRALRHITTQNIEIFDLGIVFKYKTETELYKKDPLQTWIGPRINQKPVLPLPRDLSPIEGEGSAAGYSAPWRWAGHFWGTWILAACHRSPRSYTRPHGACSQDHSWAYTADRVGDEERGRKKGKNIRREGREMQTMGGCSRGSLRS